MEAPGSRKVGNVLALSAKRLSQNLNPGFWLLNVSVFPIQAHKEQEC